MARHHAYTVSVAGKQLVPGVAKLIHFAERFRQCWFIALDTCQATFSRWSTRALSFGAYTVSPEVWKEGVRTRLFVRGYNATDNHKVKHFL
jgi:hypothetical protein